VATKCFDQDCSTGGIDVYLGLPTATKTIVTSSGSPSQSGQPVTFTATITSSRGPVPDGQVITFSVGSKQIGTAPTVNSVASVTTSSLKTGTDTVKATFAGCAFFKKSSGTFKQVVNP